MSPKQQRVDNLVNIAKKHKFVFLSKDDDEQFKKITKKDIYEYAENAGVELSKEVRDKKILINFLAEKIK